VLKFRLIAARTLSTILVSGSVLMAVGSMAQAATSDDSPARAGPRQQIEEVIVRATKRPQRSQDVSTAVTAFSGVNLERHFAATLEDFSDSVPNAQLNHGALFASSATFFMRGIGFSGIESFNDPSVAVYVDGAYLSRNAVALLETFDVESIEVMRGPQGTLFGRNAFAGAISVRSNRPVMDETDLSVEATAGNGDRLDLEAVMNVPLIPNRLAGRLAIGRHFLGGFSENRGIIDPNGTIDPDLDGDRINGEEAVVIRPSLRFQPTENLDMTLMVEYWEDRNDPTVANNALHEPGSTFESGPSGNSSLFAALGFPGQDPFGDERYGIAGDRSDPHKIGGGNLPGGQDHDIWSFTFDGGYVTEAGTFTLIANHRDVDEEVWADTDGENVHLFSAIRLQEFEATQAEFQFASDFSDRVDVIAGLFALHDEYRIDDMRAILFHLRDEPISLGSPNLNHGFNTQERDTWAAFGQADWHITEALTITTGLRYSWEEKKDIVQIPINSIRVNNPGEDLVAGTADDPPLEGLTFRDFDPRLVSENGGDTWSAWSPRLEVNYKLTDDVLVFAFWQRAHKSGGFQNNASTEVVLNTAFDQEQVDNFEVGLKSDWFDRRLRLNVNAFYATYDDLQRTIIREAPTTRGIETFTGNAAGAESHGVEVELSAILADGLTFTSAIGWLDIEYDGFCADIDGTEPSPVPANGREICGQVMESSPGNFLVPTSNDALDMTGAPTWDLKSQIDYEFSLGTAGRMVLTASVAYTDEFMTDVGNRPRTIRDSVTSIDASINWESADSRFRVSLWGKNLNDDVERMSTVPVATLFAFEGPTLPRQYGVSLFYGL
jgi:iron complex outermembrane receptor protein